MPTLRDHEPITISNFGGLWQRGDKDSTPLDHFQDSNNIKHIGNTSIQTRDGIGLSQDVHIPLINIKRIYNFVTQSANTLIVLTVDSAGRGQIHHVVNSTTVFGPLLSIAGMTDFAFVAFAGRAYISPFTSYDFGDLVVEKGLQNEFVYVYNGDGTAARKAAGPGLTGTMTVANGAAGNTDPGFHVFGFVSETDTGYLSPPGLLTGFTSGAGNSVSFGSVDVSADPHVVARHLVASKVISTFNGDLTGFDLFFVPNATINNNTDLFLNNISFFDVDLLEDASHLFDNFSSIAAGAVLSFYKGRMLVGATFADMNLLLASAPGEPEAISQIDGIIGLAPDGNPITNAWEMREILYVFKRALTVAFSDNDDEPATWVLDVIDESLGTGVHGIATVLDKGASTITFLLISTFSGVTIFNGSYVVPELTWKVEEAWRLIDRDDFGLIQIVNATIQKEIYVVLPSREILCGNYTTGMDPQNMRWETWSYLMGVNTVSIVNIDEIIIGADLGVD